VVFGGLLTLARFLDVTQFESNEPGLAYEPSMEEVSTIGLDLAKSVFQIHGIDAAGRVVVRRQLRRGRELPHGRSLGAWPPPEMEPFPKAPRLRNSAITVAVYLSLQHSGGTSA
jgi:hypothetical protein